MKNKQLTFGAIISYIAIAFNIVSGLVYTPWMVKTIGDDSYALYALATSVVSIFLLDFGIGSSVTKFLSNYYAKGEYDKANRFMGIVYKVFFAISAVIGSALLVIYFLIDIIYAKLTPDELVVFKRLYIIVAVSSTLFFPCTTFNGRLMADEQFISVKLLGFLQQVIRVALIVAMLLLGMGVYALVVVNVLTNAVYYLVSYVIIRRRTKTKADMKSWDKTEARSLFGYSVWITIQSIAQRFIMSITPTIIAAVIGSAEVTIFSLAAALEGYVYTFSSAINGMFMPKIARIEEQDKSGTQLQKLLETVGRYHIATLGLIFVGFFSLGQQFINLWMGEGYDLLYVGTLCMILPTLFSTPMQVAGTALLTKGIVRPQTIIMIIYSAFNVITCFVLLPLIGVTGACVSVMLSYMLGFVLRNFIFKKNLTISLSHYFKTAYLRWIPTAGITGVAGYFFSKLNLGGGWLDLAVKVCAVTVIYAVLYFVITLTKNEKSAILRKIKR